MIPAKIVRFLEQDANQGTGGMRDRNLVPIGCRVSAWRVHGDARTITAFLPSPLLDKLIEALQDNGQFALTAGESRSHETYQFKGTYVSHRDVRPEDLPLAARVRERFLRAIRADIPPGVPESYIGGIAVPDPAVAVDFEVREVFLQTPGPGAGSRLVPPPDA